jgi:hypothetical protein
MVDSIAPFNTVFNCFVNKRAEGGWDWRQADKQQWENHFSGNGAILLKCFN